ncbi:hypothetical protein LCGC14_0626170 [marine sediment metagenome]|uniref:DNA-directed DNA polymerase family A palm domain-containing protein n=1 Tax=marine sediment metagenome TaxID=412755 RepID=A0A0F9RMS6_9ZZZZ
MDWRIQECLRRLEVEPTFVVDVETSGLDWRFNHPVGYVLTFGPKPEDSFYLPVRHAGGGNIPALDGIEIPDTPTGWRGDLHPIEKEIASILKKRRGYLAIGHYLAFDLRFLSRAGITLDSKTSCTMVNAALIDEHSYSFSLDACARYAGVEAKKGQGLYEYLANEFGGDVDKKQMGNYWRTNANVPIVHEYAMGDGTSTWQLLRWQMDQIVAQELDRVYDVECRMINVLHRITKRGIKIDEERLHEVQTICHQRRDTAMAKLPEDMNTRAPTQVEKLMRDNGITDWPLTKLDKPSFPKEWLETNKIGRSIIAVRAYLSLDSTFITPMIDEHLFNGRVHAQFHQMRNDEYGTITGRLSSSNPNLQAIHKRNKDIGMLYRSIFIPDEGMVWGSDDYSQCEPRLLAYYSRCRVLLEGYNATPPVDAHTAVAKRAGIDRERGKRLNQAMITGAGVPGVSNLLRCSKEEAAAALEEYFAAMPEVKTFRGRASRRMKQRGYVICLLGRRARLNLRSSKDKSFTALNRLLQCGNASMIKQKMVEIDEFQRSEGDGCVMINSVHDSLDHQFLPEKREVYLEAGRIMAAFGPDDAITLDVPIVVDRGEGRNWAEATYGELET